MRHLIVTACLLAAGMPARSYAQLPAPLSVNEFGFPGALAGPSGATSAGLAMADRWLGETPFDNPAVPGHAWLAISPALQRMSRQDLRAQNRQYDEQLAFIDGAGLWGGAEVLGVMWSAYASQPVVRLEDHAYVRGRFDSPDPPAIIGATATSRELRAGLGASAALGAARVGVATEWTHRDDEYQTVEDSGSPDAGERRATFSGDAVGAAAGARMEFGDGAPGSVTAGAAVRFMPEMQVDGSQTATLVSGDSEASFSATRESAIEGGASARVVVTPTFLLTGGVGGRTAQEWRGFGVGAGPAFTWAVGATFRDPALPWAVRFGAGQEQKRGVSEPRAGIVSIGLGWTYETWAFDLGLLRRSIERPGLPTSFDDRAIATYAVRF